MAVAAYNRYGREMSKLTQPFCYAPWTSLYVRSTSDKKPKSSKQTEFSPCCMWKTEPVYYNIAKREKSRQWQLIKKRMLENDMEFLSTSCVECIVDEKRGEPSVRQYINRMVESKEWKLGELNQLDFRPSNLCNLKCAMCDPFNSSLIAEEQNIKKIYQFNSENVYKLDLSRLKHLKILGGEPSIQSEVHNFLHHMINTYKELPRLDFTSNMTNVNKKWTDIINKFDEVSISMSIDGTGETFEYLRQPARWHIVERNINTLKQLQTTHKDLELTYHVTIGAIALLTIEDWFPYFLNEKLSVHFYPIMGNNNGTLNSIPSSYIDTVVEYLQGIGKEHPLVESMLSMIKNKGIYQKKFHRQFVERTRRLDILRNRDVNKLSPRIKSYMDEIG